MKTSVDSKQHTWSGNMS